MMVLIKLEGVKFEFSIPINLSSFSFCCEYIYYNGYEKLGKDEQLIIVTTVLHENGIFPAK